MGDIIEKINNIFSKQLARKKHLTQIQFELQEKLEVLSKHKESLILLHNQLEEKEILPTSQFPIIIGNAHTRMSILDLGQLSTTDVDVFHTSQYIFPKNYKAKRKFIKHKDCRRNDDRVFYICFVDQFGNKEISCVDKKWNDWESFKNDVGGNINSFGEFFGFENIGLIKMIESLGDISIYKNYIPLKNRGKNSEELEIIIEEEEDFNTNESES
ncbi:hypothetical protein COBT_002096 [Conglomerata obtusa]